MTFNFKPKTKQEIDEAKLHPVGEYKFTVIKAEDKTSNNGKNFKNLTLKTRGLDGIERTTFDKLWESGIEKIMNFCQCGGLMDEYQNGELPNNKCINVKGAIKITRKEANGEYGASNFITYLPNVELPKGFNPNEDISY
jgi:hypothetical protein